MHSGLGCGGLIRNNVGKFIEGFMFHSIAGDNFTVELWVLILGLRLAWEKGETDYCGINRFRACSVMQARKY